VSDPYRLRIARLAARALTDQLPEKVAHAVYEFITGPLARRRFIRTDPRRLRGDPAVPLRADGTCNGRYGVLVAAASVHPLMSSIPGQTTLGRAILVERLERSRRSAQNPPSQSALTVPAPVAYV